MADDIRDNNSELNAIPGAPDPTFGPVSSIKTQWQLSLDRLDKNILSDLREMAQHRSYEYYPSRWGSFNYELRLVYIHIKAILIKWWSSLGPPSTLPPMT